MKIVINSLSVAELQKAIDKLNAYQESLQDKAQQLCEKLADEGASVAQANYGSSVAVTTTPSEHGSKIVADGDAVVFMEFGAGDSADSSHDMAGNLPFPVYPGSYSELNSQEYSTWGYWWFGHRKYYEVPPRRGLLEATRHIESIYAQRAREVFGND